MVVREANRRELQARRLETHLAANETLAVGLVPILHPLAARHLRHALSGGESLQGIVLCDLRRRGESGGQSQVHRGSLIVEHKAHLSWVLRTEPSVPVGFADEGLEFLWVAHDGRRALTRALCSGSVSVSTRARLRGQRRGTAQTHLPGHRSAAGYRADRQMHLTVAVFGLRCPGSTRWVSSLDHSHRERRARSRPYHRIHDGRLALRALRGAQSYSRHRSGWGEAAAEAGRLEAPADGPDEEAGCCPGQTCWTARAAC